MERLRPALNPSSKLYGESGSAHEIGIDGTRVVGGGAIHHKDGGSASYTAYGMRVRSELALPELPKAYGPVELGEAADVNVRFGSVSASEADLSEGGLLWAKEDEACISFARIGSFLVREGREIVVDPARCEDVRWLRGVLLGPAMAALLYQRGWLTLHASAVDVGGMAVAFVADRGWGKSTTAAAMCARGHRLVADDVTAIETGDGRPIVTPGYPLLKLMPGAAVAVGEDPATLLEILPDAYKFGLRSDRRFSSTPLPLGCIYVLGRENASEPVIEALARQEALVELIRNTYGQRLFQSVRSSSHLHQCAGVVNSVPVRLLQRPHSLEALSDVLRLVEEDIAGI
jgi:hypothetical protein